MRPIDIHIILTRFMSGELEGATNSFVALNETNAYAIVCNIITQHVAGRWDKYDRLSRFHLHEFAENRSWAIINEWNGMSNLDITHDIHTLTGTEDLVPKLVVDYECKQTCEE